MIPGRVRPRTVKMAPNAFLLGIQLWGLDLRVLDHPVIALMLKTTIRITRGDDFTTTRTKSGWLGLHTFGAQATASSLNEWPLQRKTINITEYIVL